MKKSVVFLLEMISIVILVVVDHLSKIWAVSTLKGNDGIELVEGVLKLYYLPSGNTGAAFGMFKGQLWLFILITVLVCLVLFYALYHLPVEKRYFIVHPIIIMIIAGGIGNLIDRIMNGYVVDFIYFYLINFPIFNVADCFVTVATVILAFLLLFFYKEEDFKYMETILIPKYFRKNKS